MQYPVWLKDNKDKVSEEDFKRYSQQHVQMSAICAEFETEKDDDSETMKAERFTRIMDLMQKMEKHGLPPKELAGDVVSVTWLMSLSCAFFCSFYSPSLCHLTDSFPLFLDCCHFCLVKIFVHCCFSHSQEECQECQGCLVCLGCLACQMKMVAILMPVQPANLIQGKQM